MGKTIKKKWCEIKKTLFYDEERKQLSRTAMMNFIFFILACATWIVALIAFAREWKINVAYATAFFTFVAGLTGGGFLQYSFGKKIKNLRDAVSKKK